MKTLLTLILLSPLLASANVYKCETNGVASYSQAPCSANATQLTDYATEQSIPAQQQSDNTTAAAATMDRLSSAIKQRDLRITINRLQSDKARKLAQRDDKMAQLKQAKHRSANNLAGAMRDKSLSEEMAAVAAQYDTDVRAIDIEIDRLTVALNGS